VRERTRELAIAKDKAEQADRLKSAFLATMSHELRTPLNSIIGFTGILLQGMVGELNEEQHKQLGMVRNSAQHLLSLINDVLDISKIEAGQLELLCEPFDIRDAIERAIQTVKPLATDKGLALNQELHIDRCFPCSDRRRIEQILINLLNNAVKFTETGSVTLRVEEQTVAPQDATHVVFSVTDTGIGIKEEDMVKLFKPFQQIDIGTDRRYEGTGLGLSICSRLLDLMGGSIAAHSDGPGRGSTFTFVLPMKGTGG
jgi:signal transduction histidine kinase